MKKLINSLLIEFYERGIPDLKPRSIKAPALPESIRKVWVLMGMRRTGKTWIAYQHMHHLINQGLPKEKILYINFEDDRLIDFQVQNFQCILDAYFDLYPDFIDCSDLFFCFDEIHVIPGWEKFIRRLIDQEKMQVCVTGSSANMLSKELSTTLGGRAWPQEVFPCSFSEFLEFKGFKVPRITSLKNQSQIKALSRDYLVYGGFPEVVLSPKELQTSIIQEYVNAVIFRDVIQRYDIKNPHGVKIFLLQCLKQLAAPLSVTKVFNTLKSQGEAIGKNSLFEYLSYFEDAYALFSVPIFHFSEKVRQANPKKIYAADPGILMTYSIKKEYEKASTLENAVFNALRRQSKEIFYYKTKKLKEVDFLLVTPQGDYQLFQVCLEMDKTSTREREISALVEASQEMQLTEGIIITEDYEEILEQEGITITCIPFWKWSLL